MTQKKIAIISGTSRGIGQGMLKRLLDKGIACMSINRSHQKIEHELLLGSFIYDLMQLDSIEALVDELSKLINPQETEKIWLINNAAIIGEINPFDSTSSKAIRNTINLNLVSPMLLSSMLLKKIGKRNIPLRIINISSGAAFQPIHGLGSYCVSKAGIEMFSKMLSVENDGSDFSSISIGPGVVDTGMQDQIRESDHSSFKQIDQFREFKNKGILQNPLEIGAKIVDFALKDEYQSGNYYEINSI